MNQWWNRNNNIIPESCKQDHLQLEELKDQVEDFTGCIPLLLNKCIVEGKIDLSAPNLVQVAVQVQLFITDIRNSKNDREWIRYACSFLKAAPRCD